jgi:hypothetical protein
MTVNPMTTPTVSVSQSPQGQICSKTSVTFTATAGTAGPSPSYQWKINGNNVGTNSSTFTNGNWYNNDVVSVVVTSNDPCPTTPTATAQVTESVSISPSDVITPIGPTRFCQNGHVVLSAGSTGNALDVNGGKASVGAGAYDVDVNNFTVEAWFYARANTLGTIVAQGGFTGTQGFSLQYNANGNGSLSFKAVNGANTYTVQTGGGVVLNQWHHVAVSVTRAASGNNTILYLNGDSVAAGNVPNVDLTNAGIEIGAHAGSNFNGIIDEVRIWNLARTKTNIQSAMQAIVAPNSAGLASYYRLDEGTGTTTANGVVGGAALTLSGTNSWQVPSSSPVSENTGPALLYNWSNSSFSQSISVAASGTYSLLVTNTTNTNCSVTASLTVTVDPLPTASISPASVLVCPGANVTLTASGGSSYKWSGPGGFTSSISNPTINNVTVSGSYIVTVTDAHSCTASAARLVQNYSVPTPAPSSNSPQCVSGTLNLSVGSGASYSWSGPNSFSSTSQSPSITNVTSAAAGTYTVTVTYANTCSATGSTTVVINTGPTVSASNTGPKCVGATLVFSSSSGLAYSWTGPNSFTSTQQNPVIANVTTAATGTYTVSITTAGGCTVTAQTTATVNALPSATAGNSTSGTPCSGTNITLSSSGGSTYAWSGPGFTSAQQNPVINNAGVSASGTYTVTVTDANSCVATASTTISISPVPSAAIAGLNGPICEGATLNLSAISGSGNTYSWSGPNGFTSAQQNPSITNVTLANSGTYTVTVTNSATCAGTATSLITINRPVVITHCIPDTFVGTDLDLCNAVINFQPTATGIPAAQFSYSKNPGTIFPLGNTTVIISAFNVCGTVTCSFIANVADHQFPAVNCPANQVFCNVPSGTYTIPVLTATDNCGIQSISYQITGATTRSGSTGNASGAFNPGNSTIAWSVKDVNGNITTCSTTVFINAPAVSISDITASVFCNAVSLSANSSATQPTFEWYRPVGTLLSNNQVVNLGVGSANGTYSVYVTDGSGCRGLTPATYNYQSQNQLSSYVIVATKNLKFEAHQNVVSGSVGVTTAGGSVLFDDYDSIPYPASANPMAFVRVPAATFVNPQYIPNKFMTACTVALPPVLANTTVATGTTMTISTNNFVQPATDHYKTLTVNAGLTATLTDATYGAITLKAGARVIFTQAVVNVASLTLTAGTNTGATPFTQVSFSNASNVVKVSSAVTTGNYCKINPEGKTVTFYLADATTKAKNFTVNGYGCVINANVYTPYGEIGVIKANNGIRTYMNGMFIAYSIHADYYTTWSQNNCATISSKADESEEETTLTTVETKEEANGFTTKVYPNPFSTDFNVKVESLSDEKIYLTVYDMLGSKVVEETQINANELFNVNKALAVGMYNVVITQGKHRQVSRLVKE